VSLRLVSRSRVVLLLAVTGLVLSACRGSSTQTEAAAADASSAADVGTVALPTGACSPGANITSTQFTPSYVMVLDVGPPQPMYTKKQAASQAPTSGEIMLGGAMMSQEDMGAMSGMGGDMAMGDGTRASTDTKHLVVRICHRDEGEVVTDADPEIHITDVTGGGEDAAMPVAKMQGIGMGPEDIHYGNDTSMPAGHEFTVEVHLDDEAASFQVTVP